MYETQPAWQNLAKSGKCPRENDDKQLDLDGWGLRLVKPIQTQYPKSKSHRRCEWIVNFACCFERLDPFAHLSTQITNHRKERFHVFHQVPGFRSKRSTDTLSSKLFCCNCCFFWPADSKRKAMPWVAVLFLIIAISINKRFIFTSSSRSSSSSSLLSSSTRRWTMPVVPTITCKQWRCRGLSASWIIMSLPSNYFSETISLTCPRSSYQVARLTPYGCNSADQHPTPRVFRMWCHWPPPLEV